LFYLFIYKTLFTIQGAPGPGYRLLHNMKKAVTARSIPSNLYQCALSYFLSTEVLTALLPERVFLLPGLTSQAFLNPGEFPQGRGFFMPELKQSNAIFNKQPCNWRQ
jgi:hypothetical protein